MEHQYRETFETWNKIASLYEEKFMELNIYNSTYDHFCNLLKQKDAVLEIGCGPGNITRYLTQKKLNLDITAIDVSKNMVEIAQRNNPSVQFKIMDCRNLKKIETSFNAIISGFTLPYLSKSDCNSFITDCNSLLTKNGILYLSFVSGNYKDSGYIYGNTGDRTYFYYHRLETIKRQLTSNSFSIVRQVKVPYQNSTGSIENHTIIIAKN